MRFPTCPRTILWAGMLGLAIPLVMMGLFWLHVFRIAGMWLIYVWPSSSRDLRFCESSISASLEVWRKYLYTIFLAAG